MNRPIDTVELNTMLRRLEPIRERVRLNEIDIINLTHDVRTIADILYRLLEEKRS